MQGCFGSARRGHTAPKRRFSGKEGAFGYGYDFGQPHAAAAPVSLPMLVGNIFQQFYSMVDAMIVGRFVGVDALAAVGATGGMSFLVLGFVIGLANGFCVVVSQRFGARDEAGLRRCVAMTMLLSLIVTAVATAASFLGTEPMLRAMNTPENIFSDSAAYIGIIFLGLGASLFYNLFSGLLRAVGDSKTPLYFLCLSSALNVVLDLLFVVTFSMGVAGAAWATILSQGVSALLCLVYMLKKFPILRTGRTDWAWHGPMVRRLARMGIPTALSNSVTAIGCMILQVTINGFGSTVVAAYTAASKVEQLTTQPTFTFGLAAATFTAQNAESGSWTA
ncbi:MAG: MATE family efflux transporter [Ruthenibacterium lactatiformans]